MVTVSDRGSVIGAAPTLSRNESVSGTPSAASCASHGVHSVTLLLTARTKLQVNGAACAGGCNMMLEGAAAPSSGAASWSGAP